MNVTIEKLLPRNAFLRRLTKYALISLGIVLISLIIGVIGYPQIENTSWVYAFLNAAKLMGEMGSASTLKTDPGKIFAGIYALYCALVVILAVSIIAAPIVHRFLHHFHLETTKREDQ